MSPQFLSFGNCYPVLKHPCGFGSWLVSYALVKWVFSRSVTLNRSLTSEPVLFAVFISLNSFFICFAFVVLFSLSYEKKLSKGIAHAYTCRLKPMPLVDRTTWNPMDLHSRARTRKNASLHDLSSGGVTNICTQTGFGSTMGLILLPKPKHRDITFPRHPTHAAYITRHLRKSHDIIVA